MDTMLVDDDHDDHRKDQSFPGQSWPPEQQDAWGRFPYLALP